MYKIILIVLFVLFNLSANSLVVYTAINDNNKSCNFYEEANYLTKQSIFKGRCKNGFIEGNGSITHHNGHKYQGMFHNGYYDGYGEFIWDSENYIKGEFHKNYLTGVGESYNYGNIAKGKFYKNLFIGYGLFKMKYGDTILVLKGKKELLKSAIYEEKAFKVKDRNLSLFYLKKSLNIRTKYLKNHPLTIDTYDNLVDILLKRKNTESLKEAKKYSLKALAIREKIYNKNSETISTAYNNLALILVDLGDFKTGLEYALKAIKIDEVELSSTDPSLASLYSNISLTYRELGELKEAKKYLLKSLKIRESYLRTDKENQKNLAIDYNTLSLIYQELGDLENAIKYSLQSLKITEKLFGKNHEYVINGYSNLSMIYLDNKDYNKARDMTLKSLRLAEKNFEKTSYELSAIYNNTALFYKKVNELKKSEKYAIKGLKISEEVLSEYHPELGTTYANISLLYMKLHKIKEAKKYAEYALKIREKNYNRRALMISYRDISYIYHELGNYQKAFYFLKKSFNIFLKLREQLSLLNNRAKRATLKKDNISIYNILDMALLYKGKSTYQELFDLWLKYKGEISYNENFLVALKVRTKNKKIKEKIEELIETKKKYAMLFLKNISNDSKKYISEIEKIKREKENLEEYLGNHIKEYEDTLKLAEINSSQISQKLNIDELYIDFASTDKSYYILTINKGNNIQFYPLEASIEEIHYKIDAYRENIIKFGNIKEDIYLSDIEKTKQLKLIQENMKTLANELYKLIFSKIDKSYNKFIISPDGRFNLLPFEALYTDNGKYLLEEKSISYVLSGKAFLRAYQSPKSFLKDIVIFADPSFDKNVTFEEKNKPKQLKKIKSILTIVDNLNYSKDANDIKSVFEKRADINIIPFIKDDATKANLFKIKRPTILHFSTHSLYAPDNNESIQEPLLKSVFALTGYNNWTENDFRGIVTALEFSNMNLYNTELVFFSSCQSALGDIYSSDGIYGLNHASQLAGSKRVISTIWSVADKESAMLVKQFYTNLEKGYGYVKSLKDAKLYMIKKGYSPFYWAGFIQNGIDKKEYK